MNEINTTEMKARFFCQYIGSIVVHTGKGKPIRGLGKELTLSYETLDKLQAVIFSPQRALSLRSIESLTDDEIKEVAKIRYPTLPEHDPRLLKWGIIIIESIIDGIGHLEQMSFDDILAITDYLRSISILILFMGLSTDEILKRGWAVIR